MEDNFMKANLTELVFILDRSGSMGGMENDTIGGFNSMLTKQQNEDGECRITTVLFDHEYEILHDRIDIKAVSPITDNDYFVRGQTALLDAVGKTINKIGDVQKNTAEEYRAGKVLFVITTDGMENASRKFGYGKIKKMIEKQKSKHNWEFLFLGANIDAVEVAENFGIAANRAQNFHNDSDGIRMNFCVLNKTIGDYRKSKIGERLSDSWSKSIQEDFVSRGGKK